MRGKKWICGLLCAVLLVPGVQYLQAAASDYAGEEWYDQIETVEVNREPAHASFIPYETAEKALTNEKSVLDDADETDSAYYQTLNGEWDFYWSENPNARLKKERGTDAASYTENWDTTGWDKIQVPSNIQTQKNADGSYKYDKPIYTNQRYPWENYEAVNCTDPKAPTVVNSVGHYKRTFTLPSSWNGKNVYVSFQGVESAFYLYVNGQKVGYAEDSYTADDFDITSYLKSGENTIAVEVYRWSTGSYLENQDFIRLSGIFRDVYLYAKGNASIRDIFVKTDLNSSYSSANLNISVDVKNLTTGSRNYIVEAQLYDTDGTKVSQLMTMRKLMNAQSSDISTRADDKGVTFELSGTVSNPKLWYADSPNLYRLLVQLKDSSGNVIENACVRVGFRDIDRVDINAAGQEQIQINGKKVMFRGTNRHETNLERGRALTNEDILADVQMMKAFNINAVRTAHYPNNTYLYALADELGLYICDETNAESHIGASWGNIPSGKPVWNKSVMDRTMNMVERDKNHPSIIIWSLGNEATYQEYAMDSNYCFYNSTQWILERDPSRIRKYERDNRYTKNDRASSMVDVYSSQYWGLDYMKSHIENTNNKLPYIQSEYAHAMGNGLGNLKEYWDVFRSNDNAQGGFIWDWKDQALKNKAGEKEYFAYGGDWGENITDNDFCANGMVFADGTPSPELYEAKKVLQEVTFYDEDINHGKVRIVNEFLNTNLNQYDILWIYKKDNTVLASGELSDTEKTIAPLEEKIVQITLPDVEITTGSDYVVTFSVVLKEDAVWANEYSGHAGDEIAFEQFELNMQATETQPSLDAAELGTMTVNESDSTVTLTGTMQEGNGERFKIVISKVTGYITEYAVDGKKLLTSGPVPNYWRATISNDASEKNMNVLKDAASKFTPDSAGIKVEKADKVVTVYVPGNLSGLNSENNIKYQIFGNGQVVVTNEFTPSADCGTLTRVGMKMQLPEGMEDIVYYGKGEQENYVDRNTGAKLGVYSDTVTGMFESKYVKPQENGNRTGMRWISLMNNDASMGLLVSAEDTMEVSALHYRAEDLAAYRHPYEVPVQKDTILTVDYAQRGLGNASCGYVPPLGQYQLPTGKTYTHTFSILPIMNEKSTDEKFIQNCMDKSNKNLNSQMPISSITIDGTALEEFDPEITEYTYIRLPAGGQKNPFVQAVKTADDVDVLITQADSFNGTAVIEAESPFGVKVTYTIHIKTVVTAYVSDMTWAVDEKGYFANSRDMCGTNPIQLSVDGVPVTYKKGVGAHAPSRIQVDIANKEYTRFTAVAGINYNQISNNNGKSNVNFVVKKDGQEVFRKNNVGYNSNGNVFSVPVDIDVTGAKTIELIVEKGDADYNDHVSWADAKFTAIVEGNVPLPVDKSLLQYFVNKANSLNEADYTTESWTFVASTLNTAEKVLQKGASTQEEVNSAAAALKAAIDALQEKATEVEKPLVTAKLEEGRNTNQKKVAAERVTDTNLQFVRHGFIYIDTETLGGWDLTVETAGAININIPQTDENGRFNLVMTLMRKEEMYTVKAYAIYLDKQGNERYAYSDALEVLKN